MYKVCPWRCLCKRRESPDKASSHGELSWANLTSKSATMASTPLLTHTQIQDNHPSGSVSVDLLTRSTSRKLEAQLNSGSGQRHYHHDGDNVSLPSTSTTRRGDDLFHDPHNHVMLSTSSHGKELRNSVSPSKYSDTWLAQDSQGEQINLPRRPYSWSPSQLASYLARELHAHDGTPLDSDTVQSMTRFVQDFKINGRVFLYLDQEDFQEMYDLDPFWRNAMWDAAYTLRKRALPYKRSRISNTVVKRGQVRSIMDVFGENLHGIDSSKQIAFQLPIALGVGAELEDEENKEQTIPSDILGHDSASFGNLLMSLSPKSKPEIQGGQSTQVPELIPVLLPSPSTPTDVIINEISEMPCDPSLPFIARNSHGSSFPVFQEPEDASEEVTIVPHNSIIVASTPVYREESELPVAEVCVSADRVPIETDEQNPQQESMSHLSIASQSVKGKNKVSALDHVTLFLSKDKSPLNGKPTARDSVNPQRDFEKEILQTIEILRTRLVELENQLKTMEKVKFTPEATHPHTEEQQRHRCSTTNFDDFTDGVTEYAHHSCNGFVEIVFKSATDFDVTRSWQNALILLAGATTGATVILLPGLWKHFWNRW